MKSAASLKLKVNESHLKIVTDSVKGKIKRIYINTLMPNFSYTNHLGEMITPKNCALL